jgi:hypothetical protein
VLHSPMLTGDAEQKGKTFTPPPYGFETPKHDSSKTLESSRRMKHRSNISSSVDCQRVARSTGIGLAVPDHDSLHLIMAQLDLSNVPENEFILATPNQVRSSLAIQYRTTIHERTRAVSISKSDPDTDPSAELLNGIFLEERHRGFPTRPTPPGSNRTMTTTSRVFLPIPAHDQEEGLSPVEEAGFDATDTRGFGFRLKPRFMKPRSTKLPIHYGTRPWDP